MTQIEVVDQFDDVRWRLNNLYKGVDDKGRVFNFRMNWAQEKLFDDLWYFNLILKSRQHGFTTFIALLGLDSALWNKNFSAGFCAHTRDDAHLIFENKVKFPYDNLEEEIRNRIKATTDRANTLAFSNGSKIVVGTSLRSGTYQLVHISEFGKICAQFPHKAKEIVTGALETLHAGSYSFIESTAEGSEGYFHDWCMESKDRAQRKVPLNQLQYKLHFFGWFEDDKNILPDDSEIITKELADYFGKLKDAHGIELSNGQKCWYAAKKRTLGEDIYREHPSTQEEAFKASVDGSYLTSEMNRVRANGQITKVPLIPRVPVNTAWDIGVNDQMWIVFHQRIGLLDRVWGCMYGESEGVEYYWRELNRQYPDVIWGRHFLPHDAGHRQKGDGKTIEDHVQELGMRNVHVVSRTPSKIAAINQTRAFLPGVWIDEENCNPLIKCLDNYRREWDEANGCFKEKPRHNWACLAGDTKIRTLNGWVAIKDLVGKDFHVWGYSTEQHRLIPTKAKSCWLTKRTSDLVKVVLDDGNSITCTADHRFMTRDERWVQAKDLKKNDSLMPFYERPEGKRGYIKVHLNDGSIAQEHHFAFSRLKGFLKRGYHIHHRDGDKHNNNPDNLEQLTIAEHISIHASEPERLKNLKKNGNRKAHARASEVLTEVNKLRSGDNHHTRQPGYWTEERKAKHGAASAFKFKQTETIKTCPHCEGEFIGNWKRVYCCTSCISAARRRREGKPQSLYRGGTHAKSCLLIKNNHKVISVEPVDEEMDVYDIEVPETSNFVAEGVVVHNSHGYDSFETLARGLEEYGPAGKATAETTPDGKLKQAMKRSRRPARSWKTR